MGIVYPGSQEDSAIGQFPFASLPHHQHLTGIDGAAVGAGMFVTGRRLETFT
jgi:hypothetical protein